MRNKKTAYLLVGVLISFSGAASHVEAGAWSQKKGKYYLKFSASLLTTTKEFNHLGERLHIFEERIAYRNASFRDFSASMYFEYGLTNRLTVIGSVPFKNLRSKRDEVGGGFYSLPVETNTNGLADIWLFSRLQIATKPLVVSVEGGVKLPLWYSKKPANDGAPLGTAEMDAEIKLLAGGSLYPVPVYFSGGFGYRQRGGELNDEWIFSFEAGLTQGKLLFKLGLEGIRNAVRPIPDIVGMPVVTPLPGGGGVVPNVIVGDQDVLKFNPAIIYNVKSTLSLEATVFHILSGKNTVSGSTFSLGVIFSR